LRGGDVNSDNVNRMGQELTLAEKILSVLSLGHLAKA
jgi:hypothetical protein